MYGFALPSIGLAFAFGVVAHVVERADMVSAVTKLATVLG